MFSVVVMVCHCELKNEVIIIDICNDRGLRI